MFSFKRESKNQKGRTEAESGYFSGAGMIDSQEARQNKKSYGNGVNSTPNVRNDVEQKMGSGKVLLSMNLIKLCLGDCV